MTMRSRWLFLGMMILGVVPADIATYRVGLSETLAAKFDEILGKVRAEIERFAREGIRRGD